MRISVGVAMIMAAISAANAESPQAIVFSQECKQIDPKITGFECRFNKTGMELFLIKDRSAMPPDEQKKSKYEFNRIALRYIELGGINFTVRAAHWKPSQVRNCWRRRNTNRPDYYCINN